MNPDKRIIGKIISGFVVFLLAVCLCLQPVVSVYTQAEEVKELDLSVDTVLTDVSNYILSVDTNPDYSSTWNVIGLVRSGRSVPPDYISDYYNNTVNYLKQKDWQLSRTKYSDYSKLILGMTAIGKDARDIDGHNILEYLSDFSKVKLQGFNGPIWALIALNSHPDYEIPLNLGAAEQTTEEGLIQYLLGRETPIGGWTLFGENPDTDITGMTIQALSSYYGKRDDVTAAIDRALEWLSSAQNEEGGYSTLNGNSSVETSESDAQVIVALSALGIDSAADSRFVQSNGKNVLSRLFEYYISEGIDRGGFMHIFADADNNGGGAAGTLNGMATEQGMYATAAYQRMLEGKTALYDMSDITLNPGETPEAPPPSSDDIPDKTTEDTGQTDNISGQSSKVKVTKLVLDYKQITLKKGKTRTLKLKVYPTNASNKKVKWTSSNKKIVRVNQKGKVRAIKVGQAKITVTAKDGSKKKAVCKVIVKKTSSAANKKTSSSGSGKTRRKTSTTDQTYISSSTNRQTGYTPYTSGQGNSGLSPGTTGQGGTGNVTSDDNETGSGSQESSTQAEAWNFDGANYVPDGSTESPTEQDTGSGNQEDLSDGETEEDIEEDEEDYDESEMNDEDISNFPPWMSVLFGLLSSGSIAAAMKVPWMGLKKKMWILLLSRRRR